MGSSSYHSTHPMYNRELTATGGSSKMSKSLVEGEAPATPRLRRESRPMSRRGSAVSHRSRSHVAAGASDAGGSRRSRSEARPGAGAALHNSRRQSCGNLSHQKRGSASSVTGKGGPNTPYHTPGMDAKPYTGRERCYDQPKHYVRAACHDNFVWDHGKYKRDECGSGIVPKRFNFAPSRKLWCKTPLTMYQATIGELGRQILCREKIVPRDVKPGPPCNIAEYILPPCRGYYRRYDCLRPCEEEYTSVKQGHKTYRDRVDRYWEPCLSQDQKNHLDVNTYAGHNVYLGIRMRRKNIDLPCW